ncbi:DNA-3-methyladenine glycosylase I [Pontivivens ytuae]|uniref:DNA-3-methyladenine glycosylase I n=1 Tax=Pontivivens ytuae TaxID=2789856 RepID=A0A7S9LRH9_9RHOB|nr:DNA-3-methyladenine glycosylase I [Pontivivens ytuae]QPH53650.1 DNA-3-methyladenine glycosylase I [Pontivivens ytuae]
MRTYDQIFALAAERQGGAEALEAKLTKPMPQAELEAVPDDRWLSAMTRAIFQAGFNWKVVDSMWPGFETAFRGFDVGHCAMMSDERLEELTSDTSIVRHGAKIRAVRENAAFLQELAQEHGQPAGVVIARWPAEDYVGLLAMLKKRGTRLGGTTAQYMLRFMGRDSFILAQDVVARLEAEGVIDGPATSQKAQRAIQAAFNEWAAQSGRSLTEISRTLAMSIG